MQAVKRQHVKIEIIPEDSEGDVDLDALEELVSSGARKPALIAIMHIPTSSGRRFSASSPACWHSVPCKPLSALFVCSQYECVGSAF